MLLSKTLLLVLVLLILLTAPTAATNAANRTRCTRRVAVINPPTLFDPLPFKFSHLSVDTFNRVAYIAGQISLNTTAAIVGSTLADQLVQIEANLRAAMRVVDARNEDILMLRGFIADFQPVPDLATWHAVADRFGSPPATVVGVTSLAVEGLLMEVEMQVVVGATVAKKFRCA